MSPSRRIFQSPRCFPPSSLHYWEFAHPRLSASLPTRTDGRREEQRVHREFIAVLSLPGTSPPIESFPLSSSYCLLQKVAAADHREDVQQTTTLLMKKKHREEERQRSGSETRLVCCQIHLTTKPDRCLLLQIAEYIWTCQPLPHPFACL